MGALLKNSIALDAISKQELKGIVDNCKNGDEDAMVQFLGLLENYLTHLALRSVSIGGCCSEDIEDLISVGRIAVMNNIGRYDPLRTRPTTFFDPYIVAEFREEKSRLFFGGETQHYMNTAARVKRTISNLEQHGIPIDKKTIAAASGLSCANVTDALALINGFKYNINIDGIIDGSDDRGELRDTRAVKMQGPEDDQALMAASAEDVYFSESYLSDLLQSAMNSLSEPVRMALKMRYGIGCPPKSYEEIAAELNVSEKEARRMVTSGQKYLSLNESLLEYVRSM